MQYVKQMAGQKNRHIINKLTIDFFRLELIAFLFVYSWYATRMNGRKSNQFKLKKCL